MSLHVGHCSKKCLGSQLHDLDFSGQKCYFVQKIWMSEIGIYQKEENFLTFLNPKVGKKNQNLKKYQVHILFHKKVVYKKVGLKLTDFQ